MSIRRAEEIEQRKRDHDAEIKAFGERLEKLKVAYDRYFMGLDKTPPERELEIFMRDFRRSPVQKVNKTAIRFRFRNLQARVVTYRQYWTRTMRAIEEGRYRRGRGARITPAAPTTEEPTDGAAAAAPSGDLFESWVAARGQVGKATEPSAAARAKFQAKIDALKRQHMQRLKCDDIEYKVKVKDGKVSLVAKPVHRGS